MIMSNDSPRGEPRGWLAHIKDALFEPTSAIAADARGGVPASSNAPCAGEALDQALLDALHHAVTERLGPSFAEYRLQADALSEAIPDETLQLRAVLRVLAKKGIPIDQLVHEIDAGLEALVAKQAAWAEKAASRRSARAEDRKSLDLQYEKLVSDTQAEVQRLKQTIEAREKACEDAAAERARRHLELDDADAELAARMASFDDCYATVRSEYVSLREKLTTIQKEKV
jgi:hypothetical protein